jgi:signal peptidase I
LEKTGRQRVSLVGEVFESLIIAVILALIIRLFIFQFFVIPSESMKPTLLVNDRIVVAKFSYYFSEPQRGEMIVFKYPRDPKRAFVKRLVALEGETVALQDSVLYINGEPVPEPYLPEGLDFADFGPVQVPEGHLFMLGDNRNNSDDSRVWGFLQDDLLIGKLVAIYWPIDRIGVAR